MPKSCLIMGVVNLTPDSFSDGGAFAKPETALKRVNDLLADGADLVDLGAESTRPGAIAISPSEEWQRLGPVLRAVAKRGFAKFISVDTRHSETMLRCADLGVAMINNVSGLSDEKTLVQLAKYEKLSYVAMHMHGSPQDMQLDPLRGQAAIGACEAFFAASQRLLLALGFSADRIYFDPGIGFGKDDSANFRLIDNARNFCRSHQMLYGVSRKSFIGRWLKLEQPLDRDHVSKAIEFGLMTSGVNIVRTHNVEPLVTLKDLFRD